MSHPLPGAGHLISESWALFTKSWSTTMKVSAWFILSGVHSLVFTVFYPLSNNPLSVTLFVISFLVLLAVLFWATIGLYQTVLALNGGHEVTAKTTENAPKLILPLLLVVILEYIVILSALLIPAAFLGIFLLLPSGGDSSAAEAIMKVSLGFLLLIVPFLLAVIYLGVRLCFSQLSLLAENRRGRAALVESWNLTKGRFWSILWREFAFGLLFTVLILVILTIVGIIIAMIFGAASNTGNALITLASSFAQAAFMPLAFIYQVKLFRALK